MRVTNKKMNYFWGRNKGKNIIYTCICSVDNKKCKIDNNLIGSCNDPFVLFRDMEEIHKDPLNFLHQEIKIKRYCKYAKFEKLEKKS